MDDMLKEKEDFEKEDQEDQEDREETLLAILDLIYKLDDFGATQADYQEIITYLERRIIVYLRHFDENIND